MVTTKISKYVRHGEIFELFHLYINYSHENTLYPIFRRWIAVTWFARLLYKLLGHNNIVGKYIGKISRVSNSYSFVVLNHLKLITQFTDASILQDCVPWN